MHQVLLVNEGTVAVGVMAVAMAIAFLMVVGLGAYVLYCDALNRADERALATEQGDGVHPAVAEAHPESAAEAAAAPTRARRRRTPPAGH
jgi:hypothetical protein